MDRPDDDMTSALPQGRPDVEKSSSEMRERKRRSAPSNDDARRGPPGASQVEGRGRLEAWNPVGSQQSGELPAVGPGRARSPRDTRHPTKPGTQGPSPAANSAGRSGGWVRGEEGDRSGLVPPPSFAASDVSSEVPVADLGLRLGVPRGRPSRPQRPAADDRPGPRTPEGARHRPPQPVQPRPPEPLEEPDDDPDDEVLQMIDAPIDDSGEFHSLGLIEHEDLGDHPALDADDDDDVIPMCEDEPNPPEREPVDPPPARGDSHAGPRSRVDPTPAPQAPVARRIKPERPPSPPDPRRPALQPPDSRIAVPTGEAAPAEAHGQTIVVGGGRRFIEAVGSRRKRLYVIQYFDGVNRWHDLESLEPRGHVVGRGSFSEAHEVTPYLATDHLQLHCEGDTVMAEEGETVNGVYLKLPIGEPVALDPGQWFRVGRHVLTLSKDAAVAATQADPPPRPGRANDAFASRELNPQGYLDFLGADGRPAARFPLIKPEGTVVGRGGVGCDVATGDGWASRKHARITRAGDAFLLEDLGSLNGTFVRIAGPTPLLCGRRQPPDADGTEVQSDVLLIGSSLYIRVVEAPDSRPGPEHD